MPPTIHVIAVAYQKHGQLKVFVQSWLNQSCGNWILTVIHDGPDEEFLSIMSDFQKESLGRIEFFCTEKRFNDYGHSLREIGLKAVLGDYVLLSNADNYFIPKAVQYWNEVFIEHRPDGIIFDMVHSHDFPGGRELPAYSFFETAYERDSIDMSSAIINAELARAVGFRDKTFSGDATYFEDLVKLKLPKSLLLIKIPRILFVHN